MFGFLGFWGFDIYKRITIICRETGRIAFEGLAADPVAALREYYKLNGKKPPNGIELSEDLNKNYNVYLVG